MPICIHVLPRNDSKPHRVTHDGKCWCKPKTFTDTPPINRYSHQSQDGREFIEERVGEFLDEDKDWYVKTIRT